MTEQGLIDRGWIRRTLGGFIDCAGPLWTRKTSSGHDYGMLVEARHLNAQGIVHGGALETLIDQSISLTAWEACGRTPCVTLQLDAHFLAAVPVDAFIEARVSVVRTTRSIVFLTGRLEVDGEAVLSAQAMMKIRRPRETTQGPA